MTDSSQPSVPAPKLPQKPPGVFACLGGAVISGLLTLGLYFLTSAIAVAFANKPLHTDNFTAQNISAAVRTLVVGVSTLGTAIFGITTLGLVGLAGQLFLQRLFHPQSTHPSIKVGKVDNT